MKKVEWALEHWRVSLMIAEDWKLICYQCTRAVGYEELRRSRIESVRDCFVVNMAMIILSVVSSAFVAKSDLFYMFTMA